MRLTREEREARYWAHEDRHHEFPGARTGIEHTPRPWRVDDDGDPDGIVYIESATETICSLPYIDVGVKRLANANVLAAAPDMLKALQDILESAFIDIDDGKWALRALSEIRPIASRAIRKAKGGVRETVR